LKLADSRIFIFLTAALLAAVSFLRIRGFQDPTGGDGYFYLKQSEWLANHFQFYHADYSLVFLPLALLYKITGSTLLAYQIISSLNFFIILLSAGFFANLGLQSLSKFSRAFFGAVLVIALSFQTPVLRISFEFVKNGFALSLFLVAGICICLRKNRTALVLGLLAALSHKTVALMFLLSMTLFFLTWARRRKWFLALASLISILVLLLNPRLLNHVTIYFTDLKLEPARSLFMLNSHLVWSHIAMIALWLLCFAFKINDINKSAKTSGSKKAFVITLLVFTLMPLLPIYGGSNYEIKWRMMIFSFCFAMILYGFALFYTKNKLVIIGTLIASVLLASNEWFNETGFPWVAAWSQHAPNVESLTEFVKPGEELITHHGMQFYVDYKTPIRAKSLLTPNALPKFQLAYIPEFYLLKPDTADTINQMKLISIGTSYGLFYYEDFQGLIKQYPILGDQKNIFKVRPGFVESYSN